MITVFTKSTLSTGNGQFVLYKKLKGSWKMCTDEEQNPEKNALIYISEREKDNKIQMALCFQRDNHYYSPAVEKGELKMKKTSSEPASLGENCWFEKVDFGGGEYHELRSMSKPKVYLCISERQISTSGKREDSLHVRVEEI